MIVEFENDLLVLIDNYQTENNKNLRELAQVLLELLTKSF